MLVDLDGILLLLVNFRHFNTLPNDKILDRSKLKAFADDKIKFAKLRAFLLNSVENTVGKGENAGNSIFSFFKNIFKRLFTQGR